MKQEVQDTRFTLHVFKEMEPLEPSWRALGAAPEIGVHQTYDWCRTWLAHFNQQPLIIAARFSDGDDIAFILPLMVEKRGPVRSARYRSALFNKLNFGVFSPRFLKIATAAVMQDIRRQIIALPVDVDVIVLDRQQALWRGFPHPFTLLQRTENQNHTFQVTLEGGINAVFARGNAKRRRKKVRVSERRLQPFGGYDYVRSQTAAEAEALLDEFFAQKKERFGLKGIPNIFASPENPGLPEATGRRKRRQRVQPDRNARHSTGGRNPLRTLGPVAQGRPLHLPVQLHQTGRNRTGKPRRTAVPPNQSLRLRSR